MREMYHYCNPLILFCAFIRSLFLGRANAKIEFITRLCNYGLYHNILLRYYTYVCTMAEDLFACFGEESSEDESFEEKSCHAEKQKLLTEKYKEQLKLQQTIIKPPRSIYPERKLLLKDAVLPQTLTGWSNIPPLYLGPMSITRSKNVGGKRGWTATEDLKPGTLLLIEEPIYRWPEEQIGSELGLISILGIFQQDSSVCQKIVSSMEKLHPTKEMVDILCRDGACGQEVERVMGCDEKEQIVDMMEMMLGKLSNDLLLASVLKLSNDNKITAGGGSVNQQNLDEIDVLRMLLVLRYNGFSSGLYLYFSIFNHDDNSNCIKYMPEKCERDEKKNSELRCTKYVKKGEALTIHYLDPREVSHSTRRWHLWDQHRFDIGDNINVLLKKMELVGGFFPQSSVNRLTLPEDTKTKQIEATLTELEHMHRTARTLASPVKRKEDTISTVELLERLQVLEMEAFGLIDKSIMKLENDFHILLIRCYRLHLDYVELLLQIGVSQLKKKLQIDAMCRFLLSSKKLLDLQVFYVGKYHPDVARSFKDMAMGTRSLLTCSPQRLFALKLDKMENFHQCSIKENEYQKEYMRISNFYPNDVEDRLSKGNDPN